MTGGWAATNTIREAVDWLNRDAGDRKDDGLAALALVEAALDAADDAVANCLTVLAVTGSSNTGYRPSESTQTTYVALLEEWYAAALGMCDLDAALRAVREGK